MATSTHPISMGATPRDETMPCGHCGKFPTGHDTNRISGKLYCYSVAEADAFGAGSNKMLMEYVPIIERIDGQPMVRGEDGLIHGDEISGDGSGVALSPLESHVGVCTLCGEVREIVGEVGVKESEARSSTRAVYCEECRNNGRLDDFTREDEQFPADTPDAVMDAETAIDLVESAADALGWAMRHEMLLEDQRSLLKPLAVQRIMAQFGLAATPAEKQVEADPEYMQHRRKQYDSVVDVQRATGCFEAAKLRARLNVALVAARER